MEFGHGDVGDEWRGLGVRSTGTRAAEVRSLSLFGQRARGVASVFPSVAVVVLVAAPLQQMVSRRSIELLAVSTWLVLLLDDVVYCGLAWLVLG